jgi:hypothetical protein
MENNVNARIRGAMLGGMPVFEYLQTGKVESNN